ncbi:TonB-dependent receptor [Flavobacterium marginilacus]|uniref:TonB-dependent receptor n=1 Tax=Flavobacterium marginilacus TaxID=3003256 RepID=UPI00248E81EC|nr:TonB-dependent receptor [Flavobacterium marginilacus]
MNTFKHLIQHFIFIICIFLLSTISLFAQQNNGKLKGKITTSDGELAVGVNIILKNSKYGTVSNEDGTFEFNRIKPNIYTLQVSLTGYETTQQEVIVTENETTTLNLQLKISDKELKEVVVTSNKKRIASKESVFVARMPLRNLENPQVYSVINSKIIEQQVITNFDDALKSAAGVVSGGSEPGVRSYSYLRGFDEQAFFRNGKMLGNWTENDMANIETIEAIKGPSGTLFGGHGRANYGGVVNRTTKKPYDHFGGNISLISGSNAYNRFTADINSPLTKDSTLLARVNTAYRSEKSFQDYGRAESFFIAPSFIYNASDRLKFIIEADLFKINGVKRSYLSANGITNVDQLNAIHKSSFITNEIPYEKQSTIFSVDAIYKINDSWISTTSYAYSYSLYAPNYTDTTIDITNQTVDRSVGYAHYDYDYTNIQQYFNGDFKIGKLRNRLLVGLDYLGERGLYAGGSASYDTFNYNEVAPYITKEKFDTVLATSSPWSGNEISDRYSVYFSNVIDFTPSLHLMISLRYEYFKTESPSATLINTNDPEYTYNQGAWTPKFGLVYEVIPNQLSLFGNYMGGTKNLNTYLKDDGTGNGILEKADPEKATQWELGIKSSLFQDKLTLMASYFDIKVDNRLRIDPNNQLYSLQDGTQANKGFELELFANPITGLDIMLGYANLDAKFLNGSDAGNHVAYTPKSTLNYWLSYTLKQGNTKGLGLGFGGNYRGDSFLSSDNLVTISSVHTLNASLFYEQSKYRIAIKADNLSNEIYWGDYLNAQTPRTVKASLTFKF